MKTLFNIGNGAITLTELAGAFTLTFDKDLLAGGGAALGIISIEGSGKIVMQGKLAFDLGMRILEAHSPAALVPLEVGGQAIADAEIAAQ